MPPTAGKAWLIKIDDLGTPGTLNTLAYQRGGTLNRTAEDIDITSKDNAAWEDVLSGKRTWGLSVDGLIVVGDSAYEDLETAFATDVAVIVSVARPDAKFWEGNARITDFPLDFGFDAGATYSITLKGIGVPTKLWAV